MHHPALTNNRINYLVHGPRWRSFWPALCLVLPAFLGCTSPRTQDPGSKENLQATPSPPSKSLLDPGAVLAGHLLGTWVLVDQQTVTGQSRLRWDKMRELTFAPDGTYTLNLGYRSKTDRYELGRGLIRLHETLREGVDMIPGTPPSEPAKLANWKPAEVHHVNEMTIERFTADRLVVLEDDPQMVFNRHLPPGRLKNIYRRKQTGDFGPMLGLGPVLFAPGAGRYAGQYAFSQSKLPTMEMSVSSGSSGAARLDLNTDGTATLCVGIQVSSHFSASQYAPGGERSNRESRKTLFGFGGRWTTARGTAVVRFDTMVWNTCDLASPTAVPQLQPPRELVCTGIRKNDALPADALACRLDKTLGQLNDLALNPADSYRAGPFNLQTEPMGHISTDPGVPWLVLGTGTGVKIVSEDGRSEGSPEVRITPSEVRLNEADYKTVPVR